MMKLFICSALVLCQSVIAQTTLNPAAQPEQQPPPQYSKEMLHHLAIKTFLTAKENKDARAERLLELLLCNGFSIDDFIRAYFIINMPVGASEEKYVAFLRGLGRTEEQINMRLERRRRDYDALHRNVIKQMTGITDEAFVESLLALALEPKAAGAGEPIFFYRIDDNERLLTDADWMTDAYKKAIDSYSAERRHFTVIPIKLQPGDDSLLKLNQP